MACLCICKPASHLCAKHHQSTTDWGIAGCRLENQHQRAQRGRQCCLLRPTIMMRINQKLSPSAFLGIATNKQRSNVRKCLLSWGSPRAEESPGAKENRVGATLFACLYQQGPKNGQTWGFSDKIVGVCLVFNFYPRISKEHTDKSCQIPAKLFMSAIRSVS